MLIGAAVVVVFLLTIGVLFGMRLRLNRGDVPLLKTPEWEFQHLDDFEGQLMLRRESEWGGALLLKRSDLETVYSYNPSTETVKAVPAAQWENARGPIARCRDQHLAGIHSGLRRDDREHKLFAGEREIPTAGGLVLNNRTSPSGRWAVVVSAAGPAVPSFFPFGDLIYGQRYHEIISLPDGARVDRPIRIPVNDRNDFLEPCWTADEKTVVYTTYFLNLLVVVNTGVGH